jgi:hypothetical protein
LSIFGLKWVLYEQLKNYFKENLSFFLEGKKKNEHFGSSSFSLSQGHNAGNFGPKSKSRTSMESQDQAPTACIKRKRPHSF